MKQARVASMRSTLADALPRLDAVRTQAREERDRITADRQRLEVRLQEVQNTMLRKEDVLALVEKHVDATRDAYAARVARSVDRAFDYEERWTHGDCSLSNTLPTLLRMDGSAPAAVFAKFFSALKPTGGEYEADPIGLMCWVNPEGVKAAMRASFEKAEWQFADDVARARNETPPFNFDYARSHEELRRERDEIAAQIAALDTELEELESMLATNGMSLD